jgi:hypothetical protein
LLVAPLKNGQQSPIDNPGINPAFTVRRHLLQVKEDNLQLDQMKKVNTTYRQFSKTSHSTTG